MTKINFYEINAPKIQPPLSELEQGAFFRVNGTLYRRLTDTGSFTTGGIECLDVNNLNVTYIQNDARVYLCDVDKVEVRVHFR